MPLPNFFKKVSLEKEYKAQQKIFNSDIAYNLIDKIAKEYGFEGLIIGVPEGMLSTAPRLGVIEDEGKKYYLLTLPVVIEATNKLLEFQPELVEHGVKHIIRYYAIMKLSSFLKFREYSFNTYKFKYNIKVLSKRSSPDTFYDIMSDKMVWKGVIKEKGDSITLIEIKKKLKNLVHEEFVWINGKQRKIIIQNLSSDEEVFTHIPKYLTEEISYGFCYLALINNYGNGKFDYWHTYDEIDLIDYALFEWLNDDLDVEIAEAFKQKISTMLLKVELEDKTEQDKFKKGIEKRKKQEVAKFLKEYQIPEELINKVINVSPEYVSKIDIPYGVGGDMLGGYGDELRGFISPPQNEEKIRDIMYRLYEKFVDVSGFGEDFGLRIETLIKVLNSRIKVEWLIGFRIIFRAELGGGGWIKKKFIYYDARKDKDANLIQINLAKENYSGEGSSQFPSDYQNYVKKLPIEEKALSEIEEMIE